MNFLVLVVGTFLAVLQPDDVAAGKDSGPLNQGTARQTEESAEFPKAPAERTSGSSLQARTDDSQRQGGPRTIAAAVLIGQHRTNAGPVIVDVRGSDAFSEVTIPGAINIPLYALKTKQFLKLRDVVLFDSGFDVTPALEEVERLRKSGFASVAILEGGIGAWVASGGPLTGDSSRRSRLQRVTPASLYVEKRREECVPVDVGRVPDARARTLLPGAVHVPFLPDRGSFALRLQAVVAGPADRRPRSLVLISTDGSGYEELRVAVDGGSAFFPPQAAGIYFLAGGLDGYQRFVSQRETIARKETQKIVKGCPTCP